MIPYDKNRHFTCLEAAELLGCHFASVSNAIRLGYIKAEKDSTDKKTYRWLIEKPELYRFKKLREADKSKRAELRSSTVSVSAKHVSMLRHARFKLGAPMAHLAEKAIEEAYGKYL